MLKITIRQSARSTTFALEGRLCGQWAAEARSAWTKLASNGHEMAIVLDLEGLTFLDQEGEACLASMLESGTEVRAGGVLIRHVIRELRQKMARAR